MIIFLAPCIHFTKSGGSAQWAAEAFLAVIPLPEWLRITLHRTDCKPHKYIPNKCNPSATFLCQDPNPRHFHPIQGVRGTMGRKLDWKQTTLSYLLIYLLYAKFENYNYVTTLPNFTGFTANLPLVTRLKTCSKSHLPANEWSFAET